ncbi:MipA/OmpV family protein [Alsobacter soli]|uniref:MipA/OmpV family protein n=1 Tax=Alsobacter soli TaxID=2109933 RepID=A0A2T1HS97_9HYPH|nr:MipA/OmpV family protein [Alsobacter soli]PSC04399.1 MipA/OmpV family protein [Alsobacter soli]
MVYRVRFAAARALRVAASIVLLSPAAALAADAVASDEVVPVGSAPSGWLLTVRGNVIVTPNFPGAKDYGFIAYPSLSLRRTDEPEQWQAPDDGISFALFGDSRWNVGVVGRYQQGRYRDNDRGTLYGIHDAKWALEPGLFGEFWPLADTLRVRGELRYGINGYNGLVGNLALDYVQRVGNFTLAVGPRIAVAGSEYMNTYFGVTEQDAIFNTKVAPYKAEAGVKSVGLAASATYQWNDQWATTVRGGYDRLTGSAAESPITRNLGSRDQFSIGASASYSFQLGGNGWKR